LKNKSNSKKILFKKYRCFFCKSQKTNEKTIYKKTFLENNFKINVCINCESSYTNLIPKNKESWINLYEHGGSDLRTKKLFFLFRYFYLFLHKLRIFNLYKINKNIFKHLTPEQSTILDYGTGDGYLPNYFFKFFAEVSASDIRLDRPPFLNAGINYYHNNKLNKKKFDVIVLRHVLEHVEDPIDCIEKLSNNLNDDGFFYIEVPNHDIETNYFLKIFKSNYAQLALPFHINHFSLKSFYKSFSKKYRILNYKMEVPVLGESIKTFFFQKDSTLFSFINSVFFPIQIIINFFMSKTSAYALILHKK